MKTVITKGLLLGASIILAACASTPPVVTHDGLERVEKSRFDTLYLKPDISLSDYNHIRLEPCTVAFRANWLRSQNSTQRAASYRVTEDDVEVIQQRIAESCDKHFREALSEDNRYALIDDNGAVESPVLMIRPAIIDLDIRAPDVDAPGIHRSYTTSFGEMTLLLEMYDSGSGEILGRVTDRKRDFEHAQLQWTNRATNMADVNRFLRSWTAYLLDGLDAAHDHR